MRRQRERASERGYSRGEEKSEQVSKQASKIRQISRREHTHTGLDVQTLSNNNTNKTRPALIVSGYCSPVNCVAAMMAQSRMKGPMPMRKP